MKRFKMPRKLKSQIFANIIYYNHFISEWLVYKVSHPKVKSLYRLANLFLLKKKARYQIPDFLDKDLNMDNLIEKIDEEISYFKSIDEILCRKEYLKLTSAYDYGD